MTYWTATHLIDLELRTRAVFIPHDGLAKTNGSKMDQFAEHLANGLAVKDAAYRVGWNPAHGNAMLQRIRKQLGPQAI